MDLGGIAWRRRLRRRYAGALLGAQLWLTVTWVPMVSASCFSRFGGRECPVFGDPGDPLLLASGVVPGLLGLALAIAAPTRWLDAISDALPVPEAVSGAGVRTHLAATGLLTGTALLAPALFLGELRLSGLPWLVAALPVAPALFVLFGSLTLGLLATPVVGEVPSLVVLAGVMVLLLLVSLLQVGYYYGLAWLVSGARRRASQWIAGTRLSRSEP